MRIPITVLGLVASHRVECGLQFLTDASAASQWFHGLFMPPQKEEAAKAVSLQNRCH